MTNKALIFFFFFFSFYVGAQDPYFVNSNQSLIYLNPSFAGTNGFVRIQGIGRVQDMDQKSSFASAYGSVDFFMPAINGGMSFSSLYDNYSKGVSTIQTYNLAYAQHIWLFGKQLKFIPSLQPSFFIKKLDIEKSGG